MYRLRDSRCRFIRGIRREVSTAQTTEITPPSTNTLVRRIPTVQVKSEGKSIARNRTRGNHKQVK
jgi:hypothetical protein